MNANRRNIPPIGICLTHDTALRGGRVRARTRWTDPASHERRSYSITVDSIEAARAFFEQMESRTRRVPNPLITLAEYCDEIGDRYLRGLDPTSTVSAYRSGMSLRVLPVLGHLPVRNITAGVIDRAIDAWEDAYGPSTVKAAIAVLSKVLEEAVRDELLATNPTRLRARRRPLNSLSRTPPALPTLEQVHELAGACAAIDPTYGDFVMLHALLAARSSEIAGLIVGDVDWARGLVTITRQRFPGAGGVTTKPPKNRKPRAIPILAPLTPTLRRLTDDRDPGETLLTGPRGGTLTTGTISRATNWNELVRKLGHPGLRRHDLRHAGATWFANAGVPLHIVSDILGHASIETTKGYLHSDVTDLVRAAAQVNRRLLQPEVLR